LSYVPIVDNLFPGGYNSANDDDGDKYADVSVQQAAGRCEAVALLLKSTPELTAKPPSFWGKVGPVAPVIEHDEVVTP
jgi:hypothetical protein